MKLIMKEEGGEAICALATGEGRTIKQNSQFGALSLSLQFNIVIEMEHQLGKNGKIGKKDTAT